MEEEWNKVGEVEKGTRYQLPQSVLQRTMTDHVMYVADDSGNHVAYYTDFAEMDRPKFHTNLKSPKSLRTPKNGQTETRRHETPNLGRLNGNVQTKVPKKPRCWIMFLVVLAVALVLGGALICVWYFVMREKDTLAQSPPASFPLPAVVSALAMNGSLLAVGTKAGSIFLLRLTEDCVHSPVNIAELDSEVTALGLFKERPDSDYKIVASTLVENSQQNSQIFLLTLAGDILDRKKLGDHHVYTIAQYRDDAYVSRDDDGQWRSFKIERNSIEIFGQGNIRHSARVKDDSIQIFHDPDGGGNILWYLPTFPASILGSTVSVVIRYDGYVDVGFIRDTFPKFEIGFQSKAQEHSNTYTDKGMIHLDAGGVRQVADSGLCLYFLTEKGIFKIEKNEIWDFVNLTMVVRFTGKRKSKLFFVHRDLLVYPLGTNLHIDKT